MSEACTHDCGNCSSDCGERTAPQSLNNDNNKGVKKVNCGCQRKRAVSVNR